MPLLRTEESGSVSVGIWALTETWEELAGICMLSEFGKLQLQGYPLAARKREFLAVRMLVKEMTGNFREINYSVSGKPMLDMDGRHISITHSQNMAAVILSDKPAGIDAERVGRNISDIASRFLSEFELEWTRLAGDPGRALLYCWCCKEAVYKMMDAGNVIFKKSILVKPVNFSKQKTGKVIFCSDGKPAEIETHHLFVNDNIIVWCFHGF
jgi:phosphopantetheinyl transferase (holo-ACP synthase)